MTTQDLIETFIDEGTRAFKKNHRHSLHGRKLDRHEPCEIEGVTFTCWRELVVYALCKHIQAEMPCLDVTCNLDGNSSNIELSLSEEEQRELNGKLYAFLKKWRCL